MKDAIAFHRLSKEVQKIPLEFDLGALKVEIINFEYVPPGPSWVVPNHKHSSYEFHFVSRGKGYITMDDKTFTIQKGEFYLTGPHIYHSQRSDAADPMDECSLQCQIRLNGKAPKHEIEEAKQVLQLLNRPVRASVADCYNGIPLFFDVLQEMRDKHIGYLSSIKHLMMQLIMAAVRNLNGDRITEPIPLPLTDSDHNIVRNCILFLEDNYQDPITLEDISSAIYFSPRHLARVFKTITHSTVLEYLTEIRIARAKQLLEESNAPLEDVAQECGISSGSYLSTLFRKHFGMSPNQYRKTLTSNSGSKTSPSAR